MGHPNNVVSDKKQNFQNLKKTSFYENFYLKGFFFELYKEI